MNNSKNLGFTLLEVMIALSIFAIIAATIMDAASQGVDSIIHLEEKTLASWVAENKLTELRLSGQLSVGDKTETIKMASREWKVSTNMAKTPLPNTYRVTVSVSKPKQEGSLISLIGVLGAK